MEKEIKGATFLYVDKGEPVDDENAVFLMTSEQDTYVLHPYRSTQFSISYGDDPFLEEARKVSESESLDTQHPTGVVIVVNGEIIGRGANGSDHHEKYGCKRKELGIPTGKRYDLCEGCSEKNHGEAKAVQNVKDTKNEEKLVDGTGTAYLYGHWWLCEACSSALESVNISNVVLSRAWTKKFFGFE